MLYELGNIRLLCRRKDTLEQHQLYQGHVLYSDLVDVCKLCISCYIMLLLDGNRSNLIGRLFLYQDMICLADFHIVATLHGVKHPLLGIAVSDLSFLIHRKYTQDAYAVLSQNYKLIGGDK